MAELTLPKSVSSETFAETVEEAYHGLYDDNGEGQMVFTGVEGAGDVAGLSSALAKQKREAQALKDQMQAFEGMTAEEVTAFRAYQQQQEDGKLLELGDVEAIRKAAQEAIKAEYDAKANDYEAKLAEQNQKIENLVLGPTLVRKAAALQGFNASEGVLQDLETLARQYLTVSDGEIHRIVNGEIVYDVTGDAAVDQFVNQLATLRPFWFHGNNGGGTPPGNQSPTVPSGNLKRSEMSTLQKSRYIAEHGQESYFKLPA